MIYIFAGYYFVGLFLIVFGGKVKNVFEFLGAFGWALIWPLVLGLGLT